MAMEVRSEPGIMPVREPFSSGMQKSSAQAPPAIQSMRLAFTPDGTAIYKPITSTSPPPPAPAPAPYQGGGGGGGTTGSGVEGPSPMMAPHGLNITMGEPVKRKRGRPRKYGPDGTMALALIPTSAAASGAPGGGGFSLSPTGTTNRASSADPTKKARGRPPGSGKKQQMAALGKSQFCLCICRSDDLFQWRRVPLLQHGMLGLLIIWWFIWVLLVWDLAVKQRLDGMVGMRDYFVRRINNAL